MPVVPLTVVTGLCLVLTFIILFLRLHHAGRLSSVERDSLLPFAEEERRPVARQETAPNEPPAVVAATRRP